MNALGCLTSLITEGVQNSIVGPLGVETVMMSYLGVLTLHITVHPTSVVFTL